MKWIKREVSPEGLMPDRWITLSLEERGLLESIERSILLFGPIQDDIKLIARRAHADTKEVETLWGNVRPMMATTQDGLLTVLELSNAISRAKEACERAARNAAIAGRASWESRKKMARKNNRHPENTEIKQEAA